MKIMIYDKFLLSLLNRYSFNDLTVPSQSPYVAVSYQRVRGLLIV